MRNNFHLLAHGVGRGKTKTSLDQAVASGCSRAIIFAPSVLVKLKHWEREAAKWGVKLPMEVYSYSKLQQFGSGRAEHRLDNDGEGVAIIYDECHRLKNSQSLQGLGAFKMVRDNPKAHIWLLSGTPAPNGYVDFCNYCKMTGFVKNKTDFFDRYVVQVRYRGFPEIKGYQNTAELDQWWKDTADVVPPKVFTTEQDIWVELPSVMDEVYAKKTRVGLLNGEKYLLDTPSSLAHFCRLCVSMSKMREDWLENFLDSTDENIVVFTAYKLSAQKCFDIAKKLGKKVYRIDGSTKTMPIDSELDKLRNSVTVVNYQSGGAGLNLQYANHAVFYNPTYSYADYIQARGRISRQGQTRHCVFYHLKADRSIENDIYDCLKNKADFSEKLWGDKFENVSEEDDSSIM